MACCVKIWVTDHRILTNAPRSLFDIDIMTEERLYLDVPGDFNLRFTKSANELNDLSELKIEGILDFDLPFTEVNDWVFRDNYLFNTLDNDFGFFEVCVQVGSIITLEDSMCVTGIVDKDKKYRVRLRSLNSWPKLAAECRLCDIPYDDVTNFSFIDIQASWADNIYLDGDPGLYFPVVHYGGWFDTDNVTVEDYRPWFHILRLLQEGFCKIGWNFRSPILETDWGRSLITYISDNTLGTEPNLLAQKEFRAEVTGFPIAPTVPVTSAVVIHNTEIFDPNNGHSTITGEYSSSGIFNFFAAGNVTIIGSSFGFNVEMNLIKEDSSGTSIIGQTIVGWAPGDPATKSYQVEARNISLRGSVGKVRLEFVTNAGLGIATISVDGAFYNEAIRSVIGLGDSFNPADFITCDKTLLDILEGVAHLLGDAKVEQDLLTKTVTLYSTYKAEKSYFATTQEADGYFEESGVAIDLTEQIVCDSMKTTNNKATTNRYCRLEFATSGDSYIDTLALTEDNPLHSRLIDFGTAFPDATTIKSNPFFEPTADVIANEVAPKTLEPIASPNTPIGAAALIPALWDNTDGEISYDIEPRILVALGQQRQLTGNGIEEAGIQQALLTVADIGYASQCSSREYVGLEGIAVPNVVYGIKNDDLYNSMWRKVLQNFSSAPVVEFLASICFREYWEWSFRKLYCVNYRGRPTNFRAFALKDQYSCLPKPTILQLFPPEIPRSETLCYIAEGDRLYWWNEDADNTVKELVTESATYPAPIPLAPWNPWLVDWLNSLGLGSWTVEIEFLSAPYANVFVKICNPTEVPVRLTVCPADSLCAFGFETTIEFNESCE